MKYENIYWDEYLLRDDHLTASILAIGDSWFWYPFPGGSLLNALSPILKTGQHTVLAVGKNGAEAFDYVTGTYKKLVDRLLTLHGGAHTSAVFISGGGNDFAGYNDLRPLLGINCSAASDEDACYLDAEGKDTLGPFMNGVRENLDILIGRVFAKVGQQAAVFLHNYDYAIPSGHGVGANSWLLPALEAAKVPGALRARCIGLLIDRYTDELNRLAEKYHPRIEVVDTRGTLTPGDWANELHPSSAGFKKIAEKWRPPLRTRGLIP